MKFRSDGDITNFSNGYTIQLHFILPSFSNSDTHKWSDDETEKDLREVLTLGPPQSRREPVLTVLQAEDFNQSAIESHSVTVYKSCLTILAYLGMLFVHSSLSYTLPVK